MCSVQPSCMDVFVGVSPFVLSSLTDSVLDSNGDPAGQSMCERACCANIFLEDCVNP